MRRSGTRALTAGQAACGLLTVAAAGPVARAISGRRGPEVWLTPLIRVLGARQIAQAALVYTVDDPLLLRAGAVVDVLHAASMVPVIARSRRFRLAAGASATLASLSAVGGLAVADRGV